MKKEYSEPRIESIGSVSEITNAAFGVATQYDTYIQANGTAFAETNQSLDQCVSIEQDCGER